VPKVNKALDERAKKVTNRLRTSKCETLLIKAIQSKKTLDAQQESIRVTFSEHAKTTKEIADIHFHKVLFAKAHAVLAEKSATAPTTAIAASASSAAAEGGKTEKKAKDKKEKKKK
jgi:hypothetical protein